MKHSHPLLRVPKTMPSSAPEDFFYVFDIQKRFTYVNPALLKLWKKELPEVIGKNFYDLGYPEHLVDLHERQLNEVLTGKIVHGENDFTDQDGETNFYEYTFVPVMNEHQEVTAITGSTRNVTQRKLVEQQLKAREEYLQVITESMPQMAFVADAEGHILYYNQSWYDYVQLEGTEGWGWTKLSVLHPDDLLPAVERWNLSLRTGIPYELEYRLRRFDGVYLWHLGRALPAKDNEGKIVLWIGTNTDIHDQRMRQERMMADYDHLNSAHHQLEEERVLREALITGISHDLRTPLTSAKINSQILIRKSQEAETKKFAARIITSIERADRMIRDILDVSRMESGKKLSLNLRTFTVNHLLSELLDDYRSVYGERFELTTTGEVTGSWDEDMLKRVVENLINNAIKYGASEKTITVSVAASGPQVTIAVHNEGHPIPAAEIPGLFNAFQRTKASEKGNKIGWGIGLPLVRGLCQSMGGDIRVASSASTGTVFTVSLPLKVEEEISS